MFPLGYLPDPRKRPGQSFDLDADEVLSAAPIKAAASNRALVKDVLDQGPLNSCVANAVLQAVRASQIKQGASNAPLGSRLFAYWFSRAYHSATHEDLGTYLRTCFQALNKFGFPPESVWPYETSRWSRMPGMSAVSAAFDQRSPTVYRRIYDDGARRIDAIKRALGAGFLVAFGTNVSNDFVTNRNTADPIDPPRGLSIAGGHAMCVVGFDGDRFDVVNSWGTRWGNDGFCTFTADYLAWSDTRDLWIVENAPVFSK